MKRQRGFTLIEVLVATFLVAMILLAVLRSQMQMSAANANANLQITQAAVAEAAGFRYSSQLATQGFEATGDAGTDFASIRSELPPEQQELLNNLSYSVKNAGGAFMIVKVWIKDHPEDPRQVEFTMRIPH